MFCHFARRGRDRGDALLSQRLDQRSDQKRRAAGRLPARRRKGRFRLGPHADRHQRGHSPGGERGYGDQLGRRVHREGGQELLARTRLGQPSSQNHGDGQLLQSGQQEGQKAKRRTVSPVGIVDHQGQGALGGQVGAQPIQPVQDRERGIRSDRRPFWERVAQSRQAQQPRRHPGRSLQQAGPLLLRRTRHDRLDQLAHNPEGELSFQLGAAGPQYPESHAPCHITGRRQQHGLADPCRPLHHQCAAVALVRPL